MTRLEWQELRYLLDHPGIWGGVLDLDEGYRDPDIVAWEEGRLIEARKRPDGKLGYYLTEIGYVIALNPPPLDKDQRP